MSNETTLDFVLPYPIIKRIPDTMPTAKPSLWNNTYTEVDANFNAIVAAIRSMGGTPNVVKYDTETGGAIIPVGTTEQRGPGFVGKFRYNSTLEDFEGYTGQEWLQFGIKNTVRYDFVYGSAQLPFGAANQAGAPLVGRIRFNTTLGMFEGADGTKWIPIDFKEEDNFIVRYNAAIEDFEGYNGDSWIAFDFKNAVRYDTKTGGALIPVGTTAQRGQGVLGKFRYNSQLNEFEGYENNAWVPFGLKNVVRFDTTTGGALLPVGNTAQAGAATLGKIRYNTDSKQLEYGDGTSWQQFNWDAPPPERFPDNVVRVDTETGGALMPYGTTEQRGPAIPGKYRFNETDNCMEYSDGTQWHQLLHLSKILNKRMVDALDITIKSTSQGVVEFKATTVKAVCVAVDPRKDDVYVDFVGTRTLTTAANFVFPAQGFQYVYFCVMADGTYQLNHAINDGALINSTPNMTHYSQLAEFPVQNGALLHAMRRVNNAVTFLPDTRYTNRMPIIGKGPIGYFFESGENKGKYTYEEIDYGLYVPPLAGMAQAVVEFTPTVGSKSHYVLRAVDTVVLPISANFQGKEIPYVLPDVPRKKVIPVMLLEPGKKINAYLSDNTISVGLHGYVY